MTTFLNYWGLILYSCQNYCSFARKTHLGKVRLIDERDKKGICAVAPECAFGRLYRLVRTTHYAQRGGHRVVSDAVYERDSAGVHGFAESRVAQVPATLWLWSTVGIPLDSVLWQH